jgi:tetratricopeptide (TPR) repeat protein
MNKETFLQAISHPKTIATQDLETLEDVVENFPYCQLAHLLIAKGNHDQASMLAPQKLKKAAAYAINRDVLKKLILDDSLPAVENQPLTPPNPAVEIPASDKVASPVESQPEEFAFIFDLPPTHEDALLSELESTIVPVEVSPEDAHKVLERQRQLELIENFIKTAPRLKASRADDAFPDKDLSEKSSSLNNKLISESLAKIMLKQGKVEKAISIYQELICKYPEKKSYFAGKIDELTSNK